MPGYADLLSLLQLLLLKVDAATGLGRELERVESVDGGSTDADRSQAVLIVSRAVGVDESLSVPKQRAGGVEGERGNSIAG